MHYLHFPKISDTALLLLLQGTMLGKLVVEGQDASSLAWSDSPACPAAGALPCAPLSDAIRQVNLKQILLLFLAKKAETMVRSF